MTTDVHNLGNFVSLAAAWEKYPNGAMTGDYIFIGGVRYYWDKYERQWLTRVDTIDLNIECFDISTYDFEANDWRESLPNGKYSVISEDKIIGNLLKTEKGFVLDGFVKLYQGENVAVHHSGKRADKSRIEKANENIVYIYNDSSQTYYVTDHHVDVNDLEDWFFAISDKPLMTSLQIASTDSSIEFRYAAMNKEGNVTSKSISVGQATEKQAGAMSAEDKQYLRKTLPNQISESSSDINTKIDNVNTELSDNISSLRDDVNTLNNEVDNIKEDKGQPNGFASLDSDGKVPINELPEADGAKPGILKSGQESRIQRNYIGELFMELTEDSDADAVKRAFTPKGESEPRMMRAGDYISTYGIEFPRNLLVISTGLDYKGKIDGGYRIHLIDGAIIYGMLLDKSTWKIYEPLHIVDKRKIYENELFKLNKESTEEDIKYALTARGELSPSFPEAGDFLNDLENVSYTIIQSATSSVARPKRYLFRLHTADGAAKIIVIDSSMTEVINVIDDTPATVEVVGKITDKTGDPHGTLIQRINSNKNAVEAHDEAFIEDRRRISAVENGIAVTEAKATQNADAISALQTTVSNNKDEQDAIATEIVDHEKRLSEVEDVSGVRDDIYFSLKVFSLYAPKSNDGVVKLYRWTDSGKYIEFILWDNFKANKIDYRIEKEWDEDWQYFRLNIVTEDETLPLQDFVCSGRSRKKRRWAVQLVDAEGRPQTALFEFKVSSYKDENGETYYKAIKTGQQRGTASRKETRLQGFFLCDDWLSAKENESISLDFYISTQWPTIAPSKLNGKSKIPSAGDIVRILHEDFEGTVISIIGSDSPRFDMLFTVGYQLYEMGFKAVYDKDKHLTHAICTSPAKTLCDDIYGLASKLRSGTLRDLYISAGAKYNEQTGYYELNGLTDITEEEMREIYKYAGTPQVKAAFAYSKARTNLPMPGMYNGHLYACMFYACQNLEVAYLGKRQAPPTKYDVPLIYTEGDNSFYLCQKLKKIYGKIHQKNAWTLMFGECYALEEVRIAEIYLSIQLSCSPNLSKESVQYMIENANPPSGAAVGSITITLHPTAYARLKDDADIVAALEAKNGVITLVSA